MYITDGVRYNADAVGAFNILRKYLSVSGKQKELSVAGLKNPEIIKVAVQPKGKQQWCHGRTLKKGGIPPDFRCSGNLVTEQFTKYDVDFTFDGVDEGVLTHGKSEDYQLTVDPGEYLIGFISKDSSSVGGETMLKVEGDCNVSYKIECHKDEISIEVE